MTRTEIIDIGVRYFIGLGKMNGEKINNEKVSWKEQFTYDWYHITDFLLSQGRKSRKENKHEKLNPFYWREIEKPKKK